MKPILVAITLGAALFAATPALAASSHTRPGMALATFRLTVAGAVPAGETFWVAYGPLGGRFGIIQLQRQTDGTYSTLRRLPTGGRATFVYLAGHGAIHTRAGLEPGNPVTVIKQFGPTSIWPHGIPAVIWHPAAG